MGRHQSPARVAIVTGATSGLGYAIAKKLSETGYRVFGFGRNLDKIDSGAAITGVQADVCNVDSIRAAVEKVLETSGRIDVLVACAGMGVAGAVEETPLDLAIHQMDVNYFGTVRTVTACLEPMRKQGFGKILVVGSIAGRIGLPYQAFYSSSKFALEGFVESLRFEVSRLGIDVSIVEPGDFKTGFTSGRKKFSIPGGAYEPAYNRILAIYEQDELNGKSPDHAARKIVAVLGRKRLPLRFTVGSIVQIVAPGLKRIIPAKWFEQVYRIYYKVK